MSYAGPFSLTIAGHSPLAIGPAGEANVTVRVQNTGGAAGRATVALYFSKPLSSFVRYHKMLGAFAKTEVLAAGDSVNVAITLPAAKLASFNASVGQPTVESGSYLLQVAEDSVAEDTKLQLNLAVSE